MSVASPVRVRFAPSPTGFLHVGGARTALFNWLFARRHKGTFILRIEDTDRERSDAAMTDAILEGLSWLGLDWDEGPVHQADGFAQHQQDAWALLERGAAYRCFCTPAELEAKRAAAGETYRYDGTCRKLSRKESDARAHAGKPFTLRFAVPDGVTAWDDAVHERLEIPNAGIDDFIILRTDGTPIYNMAVVSDDVAMRITHVIRGDDHISNTPRQILIYQALEKPLPVFAHVPMILGSDGKRLSKRHGATAVGEYEKLGILPAALRNFLALLGWSPGGNRELMALEEMIQSFSLEAINKKSAIFDLEKLSWMNSRYINALSAAQLQPLVLDELSRQDAGTAKTLQGSEQLARAIDLVKPRARTIGELATQVQPFVTDNLTYDQDAVKKHWTDSAVASRLSTLRVELASVSDWRPDLLEAALRDAATQSGVAAGKLIHPLRVALTGSAVSPGIFEVLAVLGREVSLQRIDLALAKLNGEAT